jgi:hypothetical protein
MEQGGVERRNSPDHLSRLWPLAVIALGGVLTVGWIGFLLWGAGRVLSLIFG